MFIALRNSKLSLMNYLFEKEYNSECSEIEMYSGLSFLFTFILNSYRYFERVI